MTTPALVPARPDRWSPPNPMPSRFETPRLVLRWYEAADAPALFGVVSRSRGTLLPWLPWAKDDYRSVEDAVYNIEWFRRGRLAWDDAFMNLAGYVMGVFSKDDGSLIGGTGLNRFNRATHNAEVGYFVDESSRKRGYAGEMTRGVLSWAFTPQDRGGWGLRRVHIFAASANTASCAIPERLGLRREMRTVSDRYVEGHGWCDTLGWGVLADEWDITTQKLRAGSP